MSRLKNYQELNQHSMSKSGSTSKRASCCQQHCCRLKNTLCWCLPVRPSKIVQKHSPKSFAIDLAIVSLKNHWEITGKGTNLDSNLNSAAWSTLRLYLLWNPSFKYKIWRTSLNCQKNLTLEKEKSDTSRKIWHFKCQLFLTLFWSVG